MTPTDVSQPHACAAQSGFCRIHGAEVARLSQAHAAEVVSLRRRIAELEDALAATAPSASSPQPTVVPKVTTIVFAPPTAPAVVPADGAESSGNRVSLTSLTDASAATTDRHQVDVTAGNSAQPSPAQPVPTADPATDSPTGAADSWTSADASFEERMAARAFFGSDGEDDGARAWLLG